MKVRQNFVSNSSSSSFVIGLPKGSSNILEALGGDSPATRVLTTLIRGKVYKTPEEWLAYAEKNYCLDPGDQDELEELETFRELKLLRKGFAIVTGRIDYNDTLGYNMLEALKNEFPDLVFEGD